MEERWRAGEEKPGAQTDVEGDRLAFSVGHGGAFVTRTTWLRPVEPVDPATERGLPPLAGLLADCFRDRKDGRRFIEEERRGWEERPEKLGR